MRRRSFITCIGALIAAPAIVRAESLMQVKPIFHYGPHGLLTPAMITEEAVKQYRRSLAGRASAAHPFLSVACREQYHVGFRDRPEDRELSIEDYSSKFITPAIKALADAVVSTGRPLATQGFPLPRGVQGTVLSSQNVPIRFLSGGREFDDVAWNRFDVGVA